MKNKVSFSIAIATSAVIIWGGIVSKNSIASESQDPTSSSDPTPLTALAREAAAQRSKQIGKVSYTLWFGLDPNRQQFEGRTVIHFDLKSKGKDHGKKVLVDLEQANIHTITVNGKTINDLNQPERYDGHHIYFKLNELTLSSNRIEVAYSHHYNTDGNGLHRFKDPVDGKVYLYSQFEPYHAHWMFPCFDQPDLKATYELTVEAPKDWTVISNTLEREVSNVDGRKSWIFPLSPVFSTYVFALHAGPYASWKSNSNGIPIRLFARKSLAQYVDSPEWFKVTQQGLEFFGVQFGYSYPFTKYDQIIVPDFNAGAMENVGAVTFSERYVHRTKVTQDQLRDRADTILHEMAHMWFGDLVTMRWWNGLWLNESFATLMSSTALGQATDFQGSWQSFFADMKQWAYWEDQLVTTHPIELPVPDTDHAQANFDGITYGKGAASLKQLRFFVGEDEFKEGLQRYFQKFAFRNTSISDFMKMQAEASNQDLAKWQKQWLQTSGVNTLRADWECTTDPETGKSKISKMDLLQGNAEEGDKVLRPHKTQVALFQAKGKNKQKSPFSVEKVFTVAYSTASTPVADAIGAPCPAFVFPNHEDYDYVKVDLDTKSLEFISRHFSRITDPFTRQMLWHTLWEMVVDGKMRTQDYADIVLKEASHEKDTQVLTKILHTLAETSANRGSVLKYLSKDSQKTYQAKIEPFIRSHLLSAPGNTDLQIIWFQAFLEAATSPASIHLTQDLLNGKRKLKSFEIDQERRWDLIEVLSRNGTPNAEKLIATELQQDLTDMGLKSAIAAEAMIPNSKLKQQWLNRLTLVSIPKPVPSPTASGTPSPISPTLLVEREDLSLAQLRAAMANYHILGHEEWIQAAIDPYFETIARLATSKKSEDEEYIVWFTRFMFPSLCSSEIVEKTKSFIKQTPNLPASVLKKLRVHQQEEERCIRAREKSNQDKK